MQKTISEDPMIEIKKPLLAATGIAIILLILAIPGESDYQEHLRQQAEYCEFVNAGVWPEYKDGADCAHAVAAKGDQQ